MLDDGVEVGAFVEVKRSASGAREPSCGTSPIWATPRWARASTSARPRSRPISTAAASTRPSIGDRSRIGAGAILVAPVSIGKDAVVGANAVVTRNQDVADGQTVVGVPARPIERKPG